MEENSGAIKPVPEIHIYMKDEGDEEEEEEERTSKSKWGWLKRVLDPKEAKEQVLFSVPMILTNVFYYSIPLVSVMFAGHFSSLELAGATLANSWITATGFASMIGLSGALETLCGQAFGAGSFSIMGIHLQAACLTTLLFSMVISFSWIFTEPILLFLRQDPHISRTAAIYTKFMMPSLFAFGFLQNILRFLQTQSTVRPLVLFSALSLVIEIGVAYCLVHLTSLGFRGAPLAASITLWISVFVLAVYVMFSGKFERTWRGFSSEAFGYISVNLKLALPSAAMVCLEYLAFEILVVLAGLMPNPELTTSLIAICINTEAIAYMITYSLSAAASTRVSNELGAECPGRAKGAMIVALKLSVIQAVVVVAALRIGRDAWVGFFSEGSEIRSSFASMTPLLAASIVLDAIQGILSGVARGCGWQRIAVCVNLAMFYLVGLTTSCLLAFKLNLYHKGLWIGLICGLSCQAGTLMLITRRKKWTRLKLYM